MRQLVLVLVYDSIYPPEQQIDVGRLEIDRLDVAIDESVLKTLALQAPVAEDLREVLAIKMTLYRTSAGSRAVDFLIDAAREAGAEIRQGVTVRSTSNRGKSPARGMV